MENKKTNFQIGTSIRCDFEENTWTFEMPKGFMWTGGKFLIVPIEFEDTTKNIEVIKTIKQ